MKKLLAFFSSALLLTACSPATPPAVPLAGSSPSTTVKEPTVAELVSIAKTYTTLASLNSELKQSPMHGGVYVRTHLDEAANKSYQQKKFPYPDGSTAVKEAHGSKDGAVSRVYIMRKVTGYDPANNDWFYAQLTPEFNVSSSGKVGHCISCHGKYRSKDYVAGFDN